jgi:predicted enzyme related to lactoylglutathione lyase
MKMQPSTFWHWGYNAWTQVLEASPLQRLWSSHLTILKGHPNPAQDAVPARFPLIAFAVDDLEANIERLRAHQVALPWGIEQDDNSRWVMFQDPAGNMIELVQFGS